MLCISRTESDPGDDAETAGTVMTALIELRDSLDGIVIRDGNVAQPRTFCRLNDLLRRILPVRKGRMDMQIAWHRFLLNHASS